MGSLESDTTERLHFHFSLSCIGEGNGNPLQYSCLENPRDREAWWAAVYGVTQSPTRLKQLSSSSMHIWKHAFSGRRLHTFHQILTGIWESKQGQKPWPYQKPRELLNPSIFIFILSWNILLLLNFMAAAKDKVYNQHYSIKLWFLVSKFHVKGASNALKAAQRAGQKVTPGWYCRKKTSNKNRNPAVIQSLRTVVQGTNSPVFTRETRD